MRTTPWAWQVIKLEISRFPCKERPYMPGSQTTQGQMDARDRVSIHVAFRQTYGVGTPEILTYAAQWLAYTLPCRRFAGTLADACARLGVDADRYAFIVADSHRLLLAGLPAHKLLVCKRGSSRSVTDTPCRTPAVALRGSGLLNQSDSE